MTTTATRAKIGQEAAIKGALAEIRKTLRPLGGTARLNVPSCCASCAGYNLGDRPYIFHFGGQGSRIQFDHFDGRAYTQRANNWSREPRYNPEAYFQFTDIEIAELAADVFRAHGLTVEWDGTPTHCVTVQF